MLRASVVGSQVLGLVMLRYVWRIEPLASVPARVWRRTPNPTRRGPSPRRASA
jgi:hypothetical protein